MQTITPDWRLDWLAARVGHMAWDRVHDQAWQLCKELGYVTPQPQTVH